MDLTAELTTCAHDLSRSIEATKRRLEAELPAGYTIYEMVDPTGHPVLAPLLAAQAQVLTALATQ